MMVGCANNRIESNHPGHSLSWYMGDIGDTTVVLTKASTENNSQACETEPQWTLDTSGLETYVESDTEAYTEPTEIEETTLAYTETEPSHEHETTLVAATTEVIPGIVIPMTPEEEELMLKMMSCESGGQGIKGMCLVGMTVINRCRQSGASIKDVIYAPNQYACVGNAWWNSGYIVPEAFEALALIQLGWDESQGATFFCTPAASSWHESALQFLFEFGDHRFYKER